METDEQQLMITMGNRTYRLIENHRDGWNEEVFTSRYSEILDKYDYVVGDWSHQQLRLRGFFPDQKSKTNFDHKISTLKDYILEYCSFGCAYFVLERVKEKK